MGYVDYEGSVLLLDRRDVGLRLFFCYAKDTLWFKSDLYDLFYGRCSRRDATSVEEIRFLGIVCDSMDFGGKTWT